MTRRRLLTVFVLLFMCLGRTSSAQVAGNGEVVNVRGVRPSGVAVTAWAYRAPESASLSGVVPTGPKGQESNTVFVPNRCVGITAGAFTLDLLAGFDCASYAAPDIRDLIDRAARPGASVDPQRLAYAALDRAMALASRPQLALAPSRIGLTGLRTFVWLDAEPQTIEAAAEVPGVIVRAQAIPTSYAWDFGDGTRTGTEHHGRPWTRRRPGNVGHVYETRGRYEVTATVVYVARWNVNGGPWQPLGYFTTSDSQPYPVRPVEARLARTRR